MSGKMWLVALGYGILCTAISIVIGIFLSVWFQAAFIPIAYMGGVLIGKYIDV